MAAIACSLESSSAVRWLTAAHVLKPLGAVGGLFELRLLMFFQRMPMVWDHECWAALTELSFVVARSHFWPLARKQLLILYVGCLEFSLWLGETGERGLVEVELLLGSEHFMWHGHSISHAARERRQVILVQLLATYVPEELATALAPTVTRWSPLLSLGGEAFIALLLLLTPRLGVLSALSFHCLVLMAPAPNFAGGFSACCAARLLLALPPAAASRCRLSASVALGAAAAAAVTPSAACAAFGALAVATLQGLLAKGAWPTEPSWPYKVRAMLLLTFVYAFLLPILGLQHMGSCSMPLVLRLPT